MIIEVNERMSIYYIAKRDYPLTQKERAVCEEIVARYNNNYPYGELYEGFCVYESESVNEKNVIFSGSTKLPIGMVEDEPNVFIDILTYWLKCLGEITDILSNAKWHVSIDDTELSWSKEDGWYIPK